jgi:hypothetical protein
MRQRAVALLIVALAFTPAASGEDCRSRKSGDICAAGSPWWDFTALRVHVRGDDEATTTMTMHGGNDFSIDLEDARAPRGQIIVLAGRALLMRDVTHEPGYEIDALDGAVLMHQLVVTLLDQAFPRGPDAVRNSASNDVAEKNRAIGLATASASGRLEAPWSLTGKARRAGTRIEYELSFESTAAGATKSIRADGFWETAPDVPALNDRMPLDGWTVHWLAPMTSQSNEGTILDYGAKAADQHWADLSAVRKCIADEPARRAQRRMPADAANPGQRQTLSYEAFAVGANGARKRLGESTREYRPGADVLVEHTRENVWDKSLQLDYGLKIAVDVYPNEQLTGFGLVLAKDDSGFSWEWFNREQGSIFRKLLGGGRVKAEIEGPGELVSIEFLDDISLKCEEQASGISHEVRVKKGSVLRLKP